MILTMAARLLFLLSLILLLHLSIVPRVLDFVFCFFVLCNAAIDLIFYKQKIFCFFHLYIFSTRNKQNKMIFYFRFLFSNVCVFCFACKLYSFYFIFVLSKKHFREPYSRWSWFFVLFCQWIHEKNDKMCKVAGKRRKKPNWENVGKKYFYD